MKIKDCMTRIVRVIGPDETLADAARAMGESDVGVLPVANAERLVGMITDRDIVVRGVASGKGPDAKVSEVMSDQVKYCFEDDDIEEVLQNMGEIQLRRLPVVNEEKRLVGIISLSDLADTSEAEAGEALCQIARQGGQHTQSLQ
jgi:CBS domain-containing protein